jgi:broad specificity phosphatase PhoE
VRLFVLLRHAESALNLERRVNGDPSRPVALTPAGVEEARRLGQQLAHVPFDRCVHTRFDRTRRTAELILTGRSIPLAVEPLLDDIDVGDLEGVSIADYRAWKATHLRSDSFPGGESLDAAARRYAQGYRQLLDGEGNVLAVCHEIPIRYAVNAAAGSEELDGPIHDIPNAQPYLFDENALGLAAARIEILVR